MDDTACGLKDQAKIRIHASMALRERSAKAALRFCRSRTTTSRGGRRPKFAFIGWNRGGSVEVAMDAAVTEELRLREARDHPEDPLLLRPSQTRLKAHHVDHLPRPVLVAELHHRARPSSGPRIRQAHRLEGAIEERLPAAACHLLAGEASLKKTGLLQIFEIVQRVQLCLHEGAPEGRVLLVGHGTVPVVFAPLAVAGGGKDLLPVDGLGRKNG